MPRPVAEPARPSRGRRALVLLAAIAIAAAGAVAFALSRGHGGGDLVVEPDPIDFGPHRYGERVDKEVRIVNRSDHAVTIRDPAFDCGCFMLVTQPTTLRLEAGTSLGLVLRMETVKAYPGVFHKTMTVLVESPVPQRLDVAVLGEVVDYREVTPREVAFGAVPSAGPSVERRVAVRGGKGGSRVEVTSAVSGAEKVFTVAVEPGKDGADLVLRTVVGAPAGGFRAQVALSLLVRQGESGEAHRYDETIWVTGEVR